MDFFKPEKRVPVPSKDVISWLFEGRSYDQDKPLWLDPADDSRSISSRQARHIIRKLVAGFRELGIGPGDCVAINSFNDIYYSMLVLGIIAVGGIFTGTNPSYTPHELVHHFRMAEVKLVITEPELLTNIMAATKECNISSDKVLILDLFRQEISSGFKSWTTLLDHGEQDWIRFNDENQAKTTTALRLFSSGTTGLPKAAMISHRNLIAQHIGVFETNVKEYEVRRLLVYPPFHAAGVPTQHIFPLACGASSWVIRRFDVEAFLKTIETYKITDMGIVPQIVLSVLMSPQSKKYNLNSVKDVLCGAAPLEKGVQARFKALFSKNVICTQGWGMTEATAAATMFHWKEDDTTGSVGRLTPNMEAKLIDGDGKNVSNYDVTGEICIRGPSVFPGYLHNDEANSASFDADGWFKTGDLGRCDRKTKKWYIVGRKKELIKVRGFQVSPLEIETVLLGHPAIIECAVIGITPSHEETELPRAYVVRIPGLGDRLTEKDVKLYASKRLAKYKALNGGVRFVDALPKNTLGKILKGKLKEEAAAEFASKRSKL